MTIPLFLKAKEALTTEQEQDRHKIAEELPELQAAWSLKEGLRTWYATATAATAAQDLDVWIEQVKTSGFEPLRKALSAFVKWRLEILAFFQFLPMRISNGFVEGKNNRTKALMRQGYGYRNRQHRRHAHFVGKPSLNFRPVSPGRMESLLAGSVNYCREGASQLG